MPNSNFLSFFIFFHYFLLHVHDKHSETSSETLPANVAIPLHSLCEELGLISTLSEPACDTSNWIGNPHNIDEMRLVCDIFGAEEASYRWFHLITTLCEARFIPTVQAIWDMQNSVKNPENEKSVENFKSSLEKISKSLEGISDAMSRMKDHCKPDVFYHKIRPYLSGWKGNPALPKGLFFEGVESNLKRNGVVGKWVHHPGGSAGQSCILQGGFNKMAYLG